MQLKHDPLVQLQPTNRAAKLLFKDLIKGTGLASPLQPELDALCQFGILGGNKEQQRQRITEHQMGFDCELRMLL
ncbi:hypothetical protein LMBIIBHN_04146 [Aeromonas salmonicida]